MTKNDGTVVENVYDVDGVLVRTVVTPAGGSAQVTDLLVDSSGGLSHVVAEIDGSGTVTALYVRAGDMLLEEIRSAAVKMYEADGLGSIRGLLDASGARTDSYAFTAFGENLTSTGSDANPYRFAGERLVDSVGFYQHRARWLDTRTGRFVGVDPLRGSHESPVTLHGYIYVGQNPLIHVDPAGLMGELVDVGMAQVAQGELRASQTSFSLRQASALLVLATVLLEQINDIVDIESSTQYNNTVNLDTGAIVNLSVNDPTTEGAVNGGNMVATITAVNEVTPMVINHASPEEQRRFRELMNGHILQIPDDPAPEFQVPPSRKIQWQDLIIFGTAYKLGLRTITVDGTFGRTFENKYGIKINATVVPMRRFQGN